MDVNVNAVEKCFVEIVSVFVIYVMVQFIVNDVLIYVLTVMIHNLSTYFFFY
jgi:hypothetical protein